MRFREIREKVGYSQADVARMLDVDPSAVSNWESGKSYPRMATVIKLAALYCCSIDDLIAPLDGVAEKGGVSDDEKAKEGVQPVSV